ncbi:MAG: ORF6N domain-containing protein [Opitutaceae bacterium]
MTSSADQSGPLGDAKAASIPAERIESRIYLVRGQKVMLDRDLAELYGVETRALNQAVSRNRQRFPGDFMFSLTRDEIRNLSQIVISSGFKHAPRVLVFTEQGVAMLSGLLNSPRAIAVNVGIMRAFVRLRQLITSNADLARKLAALERKYDAQFKMVFDAIRELMAPLPTGKNGEMGFHTAIPLLSPKRTKTKKSKQAIATAAA